ncbi:MULTISPECIES: hypothetical protein [unclassified Sphingobium]|nr:MULTISPECIES: hypothetical protein [unclassified Sphingobium]CAD7336028.1 hypothetical protein SPHS6_00805 [Sphingobium sp. S6]CAD7336091.1 hypothetical protein SPHS8_00845 [Sphingobium sp. S8]
MKIRIGKIASWLGRVIGAALAQKAVERLTKGKPEKASAGPAE